MSLFSDSWNRKKYLSQTNWSSDDHGYVRMFCPCRICQLPVRQIAFVFDLNDINFTRIHNSLLTRLSNDDDMEKNLSTFANEMASSVMILGLADSNSLVLIDELGRGTSPKEGVGISHAIAEALINKKVCLCSKRFISITSTYCRPYKQCFVFFATWSLGSFVFQTFKALTLICICRHFHQLSITLSRQPSVVKCVQS